MNDDISITIDRLIRYRISNTITRCQLNAKKDRMSIPTFICMEMEKRFVKRKKWYIFTLECVFRKIGQFSNVHFKQKVTSKLQNFNIINITPTGSCQKHILKKSNEKHPVLFMLA